MGATSQGFYIKTLKKITLRFLQWGGWLWVCHNCKNAKALGYVSGGSLICSKDIERA